ncbi:uncharacterized protein COLE_05458 [Cutaneotrichosporon oleaginosum]|uniref:uncharacterized protein n=1 Tax=Cutaneotrichosporon oleaginosum TaxID=879819 RepID=UPI00132298AB|nr:hypothetical protein COLE_05458 [Cutaneotrichosporon oleaginosum]
MDEKREVEHVQALERDAEHASHKPKYKANTQLDDAARLLEEAGGHVEYTLDEMKQVLRRIDFYVCLPMCITYWIPQMDKSSVSYAAVFDLQKHAGLVGTQYSWLTSVVYCAQLVCQPISAYALVALPVKTWVLFNMAAWSICTICTAACRNFVSLLICRMLLGAFEATIMPSFILITQMWWLRREQSYRTVAYQVANSCAAIFGPLMSYGIGRATEGSGVILEYQGIFLFIGAVSLAFVPVVWWLLPNSPTTARFLRRNGGRDRLIAVHRLKENNTGTKTSKFKWAQVWETYRDPKTYMWAGMWFCAACPSGGINAFGPLITKGFGFSTLKTILMQIPTGCIGIAGLLTSIYITNRIKMRWPVLAVVTLFPIAGAIALTQVERSKPGGLMAAYYVAYVFSVIQPLLVSWCNLNASGTTKRVVTTATMFGALTIGNIVGPQVYLTREAPYYRTGLYVDIACWCILLILVVTMGFYLRHLNRKQEARRVAMGLPAGLKDTSIMTHEEAAAYKLELDTKLRAAGFSPEHVNEHAFEDLTDFENIYFQYVV